MFVTMIIAKRVYLTVSSSQIDIARHGHWKTIHRNIINNGCFECLISVSSWFKLSIMDSVLGIIGTLLRGA
jgi:hypothetical protein